MSLECPICLEDPCSKHNTSGVIETHCGHLFCYNCLHEWQKFSPDSPPYTCPSCRTNIPSLDLTDHVLEIESQLDQETDEEPEENQNGYTRLVSEEDEMCDKKSKIIGCILGSTISSVIFYFILHFTHS